MSGEKVGTSPDGTVHLMVAYPFARTVGCACGWVRRNVDDTIMDQLFEAHLQARGAV